jgi:hypothetical protein
MIKEFRTFGRAFGTTAAVVLLLSAPASAQLGKAEQGCRAAAAKGLGGVIKTVQKEIGACHKAQNGAKIGPGIDCNDTNAGGFPSKSAEKIAKALDKLDASLQGKCKDKEGNELTDALTPHVSCPAPCTGTVTNPMLTVDDVSSCLQCLAVSAVEDAAASTYGLPASGLDSGEQKCHAALIKSYAKLVDTSVKDQQGCQKGQDKIGNNDLAACSGADGKGKVAGTLTKAEDALDKACTDALLTNLNACSSTVAGLKTCAGDTMSALGEDLFSPAYENRALEVCPKFLTTRILGINTAADGETDAFCAGGTCSGGPNDGNACLNDVHCPDTATSLSVGWTGLAHGIEIPDNYLTSVSIDCPGTYHICEDSLCQGGPNDGNACTDDLDCSDCGDCTITGIAQSAANDQFQFFTRCEAKPWIECSNPLGTDPTACGGASPNCAYFLGGYLAGSAGGTPTCSRNKLFDDVSGTANLEAGQANLDMELRAVVHLGLGQAQPCPICVGDTTPQDGIRDGVCQGGANDPGAPPQPGSDGSCDVHAFDTTYGPTSHDCPPVSTANISGTGLVVPLDLTTGSDSLSADIACIPAGPSNCFSAVCSLAPTKGCFTSADCLGGEGTCTSKGTGTDTQPDGCTGSCVVPSFGFGVHGECDGATDFATYCDGFTRSDGKGVLTCDPLAGSADCDALASACPGGNCGDCTIFEFKRCYLDPTNFSGTPSRTAPVLATKFPLPPTNNAGVNTATGSPAPGLVFIDMRTEASHK